MGKKGRSVREDLILRDFLAIDRTRLANQRTVLSFFRSGLYLFVTAVAVDRVPGLEDLQWVTYFIWALGASIIVLGFINYLMMRKKILKAYHVSEEKANELRED
jgi:putative membrane protein